MSRARRFLLDLRRLLTRFMNSSLFPATPEAVKHVFNRESDLLFAVAIAASMKVHSKIDSLGKECGGRESVSSEVLC